ncbi:MAG: hypothetical protein O3A47_12240, partial [Chloroflexi bacterium]|nr:hypothetical protein [Chloroflexota bacterium]
MNLVIAGCEYSGASTLAAAVAGWIERTMGGRPEIHDHFKLPNIACYRNGKAAEPLTEAERRHILSLSPKLKEMLQRQDMVYHLPATTTAQDYILVGYHVEDAVYGPMFF